MSGSSKTMERWEWRPSVVGSEKNSRKRSPFLVVLVSQFKYRLQSFRFQICYSVSNFSETLIRFGPKGGSFFFFVHLFTKI